MYVTHYLIVFVIVLTLKFAGGTTLHIPNFSAIGLILSMYSKGSWKSFSVGRNVGASTTRTSSFAFRALGNVTLLLEEHNSDPFCLHFACALENIFLFRQSVSICKITRNYRQSAKNIIPLSTSC